jgi:hypothetical protein
MFILGLTIYTSKISRSLGINLMLNWYNMDELNDEKLNHNSGNDKFEATKHWSALERYDGVLS